MMDRWARTGAMYLASEAADTAYSGGDQRVECLVHFD